MTTVLGVDPGLAATGYGVIVAEGSRMRCVDYGVVRTDSRSPEGARLEVLYRAIRGLIEHHHPTEAGVEALYFAKNVTSALPVAKAMGVVLLSLEQAGIVVGEYGPRQIKQAIVGQGQAEKSQVQDLLRILLGMKEIPAPDHAADALAAAVCHRNTSAVVRITNESSL
jgi:crossover junction endodeoxyribonuclease RuvC